VAWVIARRAGHHAFYERLVDLFERNNRMILEKELDSGISVNDVPLEVRVICHQHLNLLFLVWLHKRTAKGKGLLGGWRRWARAIVEGANESEREPFRRGYRQILTHGDLYPAAFITWLDKEMGMAAREFLEVSPE